MVNAMLYSMQAEDKRMEGADHGSSYSRAADMRRSPAMKHHADDASFQSKKLLEVSKGLQKEHLHKDASSLFSSSFEKDPHLQVLDYYN